MVEVRQADREAAARYWGNDNPPLELQREFARHRIAALDAARGDPVARVMEWLRKDADQTEIEAGHIVKNSSGNPRKNAAEWAMLVAMKRGLADAIERGDPFRD